MSEFQQGHALVIGVGADLQNTVVDAKGIADVIRNPELCAYPANQVTVLTEGQATRKGILDALDAMASQVMPESTVVCYFSGHGYTVNAGFGKQYFLMPNGYNMEDLINTAISSSEFMSKLQNIKAQKMLVLLDCCYAGGIDNEEVKAKAPSLQIAKAPLPASAINVLSQGHGRVIISSCKEMEVSYTGDPYSQFTQALVEAFAGAEASSQDGYVRASDLALYAAKTVPQYTKDRQHPDLHFTEADNFAVAYYAGGETKPKGLPKEAQRNPNVEATNADEAKPSITVTQSGDGAVAVGDHARAVGAGGVMADSITGDVMTGANARKIQAGSYIENQKVEKHSVFDQSGQTVKGNQQNIAGDVTVKGDIAGRDAIRYGDTVHGDQVGGDKYTTGDITGNTGVAIGRNSTVSTSSEQHNTQISALIMPLIAIAQSAASDVRSNAIVKAVEIQSEAVKGSNANDQQLAGLIQDFVEMLPAAKESIATVFSSPQLADIGGSATKFALSRLTRK